MKNLFAANVKYLRNKRGISQQALANEFNLSRGQVASYEDGRAEPNLSTLMSIATYFRIPIDALIRHDITTTKEDLFIDIGNSRVLFPVIINSDDEDMIEVVPIKASAGYLDGYADPDFIGNLPQMKLPFIPTGKHRAFPIKGDSMEPWVKEGAFIVGKFIEDFRNLKDGQTYVFVTQKEGVVYKRLSLAKLDKEILVLSSDNAFYKPFEIPVHEVVEAWEFTCKIDMSDYNDDELNPMSIMQMLRSFEVELQEIRKNIA